jgi:hypothetical protein
MMVVITVASITQYQIALMALAQVVAAANVMDTAITRVSRPVIWDAMIRAQGFVLGHAL